MIYVNTKSAPCLPIDPALGPMPWDPGPEIAKFKFPHTFKIYNMIFISGSSKQS